ncbi:hypothetical protein CIK05_08750 [Bdellovibrio sp. qaytius]|nr:hypothetical protein CIK05_08750 [Bdellovibrio sp. qaytius]
MEGSEFDKKRIQFLSQSLEQKKLEIQLVQLDGSSNSKSRNIASVDEDVQKSLSKIKHKDVDLSEFYFMRVKELKQKKKIKEALVMLDKIKKSTANDEYLARADYESIALQCSNLKLSEVCIDILDNMVLQYPESNWTGRGLQWLSKSYSVLNRKEDSHKIDGIIKSDFGGLKVE